MVLIDVFTRYSAVIPVKLKQPPDILAGVMEGLQKMKSNPEMIYSDEECSLFHKKPLNIISTKKEYNYTEQEDTLISRSVSLEPTRICYIKGLKQMKRKERQIYNG